MTARFTATVHQIRRYRATFAALLGVLSVAFWPSLLLPLARQYVEFNFHHPGATPFIPDYPPYAVAAILLWMSPMLLLAI